MIEAEKAVCYHQNLLSNGLSALVLIALGKQNQENICMEPEMKVIVLRFTTNDRGVKGLMLSPKLVTVGYLPLHIHLYKIMKNSVSN